MKVALMKVALMTRLLTQPSVTSNRLTSTIKPLCCGSHPMRIPTSSPSCTPTRRSLERSGTLTGRSPIRRPAASTFSRRSTARPPLRCESATSRCPPPTRITSRPGSRSATRRSSIPRRLTRAARLPRRASNVGMSRGGPTPVGNPTGVPTTSTRTCRRSRRTLGRLFRSKSVRRTATSSTQVATRTRLFSTVPPLTALRTSSISPRACTFSTSR